uniref:ZP domain-containing protein n=1 Tax=Romanomermis culicivorax TaxID=13658 RepID=A0A915L1J1_ROMCU
MMVHSCFTDDGNGKRFSLLDQAGCPQDRYLMNHINYTDDLTGGVFSQVFKYADKPVLFFQCQIHVAVKEDGQCQRPSENCSLTLRTKRSAKIRQPRWSQEYDVSFEIPTILDLVESDQLDSQVSKPYEFTSWNRRFFNSNDVRRFKHLPNKTFCLDWFTVYYILAVLCILSSLILSFVCRSSIRIRK